jgi:hypothetical protein
VQKKVIQSVTKLDLPVIQYGRVTRLEGGDRMVGRDLVKETKDSRDASFIRVESYLMITSYMQLLSALFSSILNLWIDMRIERGESQNSSSSISLAS